MKKELNIKITLEGIKLISVNALYKAGMVKKGGKNVPYIYKCAEAKRFEALVHDQLRVLDWTPHLDWLKETKLFSVTNQYILKTGIKTRDVSNFTKLSDDVIVKFIKNELGVTNYDDSKYCEEHLYKSILPGSNKEYLCISIKPSEFDVRFDHIEVPEKILLHASDYPKGMKTSWSKEKIYLDPTKKGYNTDLFLIQDPLTPMQSSEIIQSLIKHQEQGFCIVVMSNPEQQEQVFKPFCTGGRGILITQDKLISTIQKLRNENMD